MSDLFSDEKTPRRRAISSMQRTVLNRVFLKLDQYAEEAHRRGWTGPEQVYKLTQARLRKDLLDEVEE